MSTADLPYYLFALTPARLVLWPVLGGAGATLAVAVRDGRRRATLNECLHELRRPLQALALLAARDETRRDDADAGPVEMAAAALARLEREINGEGEDPRGLRETLSARPLLEAAARRWRPQAAMLGKRLALRWDADEATVEGDRIALAAALDNLVANALEHGGERIELAADRVGEGICLAVVDTGDGVRRGEPRPRLANLSGRARHGHGLRLVRRTATRHGGSFALHRGEQGTSAVLELPLAPSRWSEPAPPATRPGSGSRARPRPEIVIRKEAR